MSLLSHIWQKIQVNLFPFLEEALDPLTEKQTKLISTLEIVRIEDFVCNLPQWRGRKRKDRKAIARAFIAKSVYNFSMTRQLLDNLKASPNLRRICGWERSADIPSESVFSRTFAEFAASELPQKAHEKMIEKFESERLVGHISRDSTVINAREKPAKKFKKKKGIKLKRRRGRPQKGEEAPPKEPTRLERQTKMNLDEMLEDLPVQCNFGTKKDANGKKLTWKGYKLHVDWADGGIPVSCILTSASLHDSQAAIPLAEITAGRVTSLYDLMDSAYDAEIIKEHSRSLEHVPIIDSNKRRGEKPEMDKATKIRYHERGTAERGFSMLKDNYGGRIVRVKGHKKIMAHLMFGMIALCADQLLRLVI